MATIEAMKMEASITAPVAGTVSRLAVPATQAVEGGDLVLVISLSLSTTTSGSGSAYSVISSGSSPVTCRNTSVATARMPLIFGWNGAATPARNRGPLIHARPLAQTSWPSETAAMSTYDAPAARAPRRIEALSMSATSATGASASAGTPTARQVPSVGRMSG